MHCTYWLYGYVAHFPLPTQSFEHDLESFKADPSKYNLNGNPPLHALVRIVVAQDSREKKQKLMVLLLRVIHIYVNLRNKHGLTVLHVAVQVCVDFPFWGNILRLCLSNVHSNNNNAA